MPGRRAALVRLEPGDAHLLEARPLVDRAYSGPFRYLVRPAPDGIRSFWWQQIVAESGSEDNLVYAALDGGEVVGLIGARPLPWESEVLKLAMDGIDFLVAEDYAVAQQLIRAVLRAARRKETALVVCKLYTDEVTLIHALQSYGFLIVDTMLDHGIDLASIPRLTAPTSHHGWDIRPAQPADVESAACMFRLCFDRYFGRFHSDPRISREDAVRVYVEWIRSSFGGYADHLVVATDGDRVVGCTVWRNLREMEPHGIRAASYSIGAVHPQYSGRGLIRQLKVHGLARLQEQGTRFVDGFSHINNLPVERAFRATGFKIVDGRHTFHLWLDKADETRPGNEPRGLA